MFGAKLCGEEFPLLYVTAGNSGDSDEKGYLAFCAVEQIKRENGVFSAETVQRIYYKNDGIEKNAFRTPGWDWATLILWAVEIGYAAFLLRPSKREQICESLCFVDNKADADTRA